MYYLNARYYNAEWGRFINADAYGGNVGNLLSHNMFAYCMNNPVNMEDPSGNWPNFSKIIQGAKNIVKSVVNTIVQHVVTTAIVAVTTIVASIGVAFAIKKPTLLPAIAGGMTVAAKVSSQANKASNLINRISNITSKSKVTTTARNLAKSRGVPSTLSNKEAFTADLSNLQMSMKKISDNYLKKMNIDAHEIKTDFVGRNISKYDLYVETVTKEIYIFLKGGKGEGMPTGIYLK